MVDSQGIIVMIYDVNRLSLWEFPGGPVVKTSSFNAEGVGLILGWGAKISHALWPKSQNIKQKQYCNKFNKDFKMILIKKSLKNNQTNKCNTQKTKPKNQNAIQTEFIHSLHGVLSITAAL